MRRHFHVHHQYFWKLTCITFCQQNTKLSMLNLLVFLGLLDSPNPSLMKLLGQAHPFELGLIIVNYYATSLQDADDVESTTVLSRSCMRSASWHALGTAAFSEGAAAQTKAAVSFLGSSLCLLLRTAFEVLAVLRGRGDPSCPGGDKGCEDRLESLRGVIGGSSVHLV